MIKELETAVSFVRSLIKPSTGELRARATFHDQMASAFSLDELRQICFDLAVPFEEVPGERLSDRCRELYLLMERRGDLHRLVAVCQQERPDENWMVT